MSASHAVKTKVGMEINVFVCLDSSRSMAHAELVILTPYIMERTVFAIWVFSVTETNAKNATQLAENAQAPLLTSAPSVLMSATLSAKEAAREMTLAHLDFTRMPPAKPASPAQPTVPTAFLRTCARNVLKVSNSLSFHGEE